MLQQIMAPLLIGALSLCLLATPASAAFNVYAALTANGSDIDGDTSLDQLGGVDVSQNHIEIHAVNHEAFMPISSGGLPTGRLTHAPLKFVKPVDKASPLLQKAMSQNQIMDGIFKFFRSNPETGMVEHYYTIELHGARLSGIRSWSPNNLDAAASSFPFMEEVSMTYSRILFRHEIAGTEYEIEINSAQ